MSNGDGRSPGNSGLGHSGGKASGDVNGTSGKGGSSSGRGTDPNSGPGWGTTHTPNGDIHNYNPGEFGGGNSGNNRPGGNNGGDHGGSPSAGMDLSRFPEAQASAAYGVPMNLTLINGTWGLSMYRTPPVQEFVDKALAKVLPYFGRLLGLTFGLLLPSPIAPDDKKMMSLIVTTLPAEKVTTSPVTTLPTQSATVQVHSRIVDVVQEDKQHLAVVGGIPMSVPVVDARPTNRPGVFTAVVVPDKPALHIKVETGKPVALSQPKGVVPEKGEPRPAEFTAGSHSHDAIIRFPKESGQAPVYVSVTDVLTPAQIKERQEDEKRRQQEWDAAHPVEVLEREYEKAKAELAAEEDNITTLRARLGTLKKSPAGLALDSPELHPYRQPFAGTFGPRAFDVETREDLDILLGKDGDRALAVLIMVRQDWFSGITDVSLANQVYASMGSLYKATKAAQENLTRTRDDIAATDRRLNNAMESRKQKEKKAKDAENKLNEEKNKPRKGVKDYGHDYHPAPKTEEIKGLGELKRRPKKTPKQGGDGRRDRWVGDKGHKIYEWDSRHGELEGYRASDGEHLGSFDPKTGEQIKGPNPKRNIKKYL